MKRVRGQREAVQHSDDSEGEGVVLNIFSLGPRKVLSITKNEATTKPIPRQRNIFQKGDYPSSCLAGRKGRSRCWRFRGVRNVEV